MPAHPPPYDYLYANHCTPEDLVKYDVIFYPHAAILTEERAQILREYVKQGGVLVFGCRTAYKDIHGICVTDKLPGLVSDLTGTDIPEYTAISPDTGSVTAKWGDTSLTTTLFNDQLQPLGEAEILATYEDGYYKGAGALISNTYGKGKAYYWGSVFTSDIARVFLEKLGVANPYGDIIEVPESIELTMRSREDKKYLFVLNYSHELQEIKIKRSLRNVYTDREENGTLTLSAYETRVYMA